MTYITENNREKAIAKAREFYELTGTPVEACNVLGDPIIYITETGKENVYTA